MRAKQGFCKINLDDTVYIVPYGQKIADFYGEIKLSGAGEDIWDILDSGSDVTDGEIIEEIMKVYELDEDMRVQVSEDVHNFIERLDSHGMIINNYSIEKVNWKAQYLKMGPLFMEYYGPDEITHKYMSGFVCEKEDFVEKGAAIVEVCSFRPKESLNGEVILRNEDLVLMECGNEYVFLFPLVEALYEMRVRKNGSVTKLYCNDKMDDTCYEKIFHAIRFAFLIAASENNLFLVHSASILYRDKAWLFSGVSGTGKSTHASLWNKYYDTRFINGDLNMIGFEKDKCFVYGQPWCGTSGICDSGKYELGGIVFLKQAQSDMVEKMAADEIALRTLQRLISPAWNKEYLEKNAKFCEHLSDHIYSRRLYCTKEKSAADVLKKDIDKYL